MFKLLFRINLQSYFIDQIIILEHQSGPQFITNNGPLIPSPDGNGFILIRQIPAGQFSGQQQQQFLGQQQQLFNPSQFIQQQQSPTAQQQQPQQGAATPQQQQQQQLSAVAGQQQQQEQQALNAFQFLQQQQRQQSGQQVAGQQVAGQQVVGQLQQKLVAGTDNKTLSNNKPADSGANISLAELLFSSTTVKAPTTTTQPPPPVDKNIDLDGDGVLSLAEVQYAAFVHHGLCK